MIIRCSDSWGLRSAMKTWTLAACRRGPDGGITNFYRKLEP